MNITAIILVTALLFFVAAPPVNAFSSHVGIQIDFNRIVFSDNFQSRQPAVLFNANFRPLRPRFTGTGFLSGSFKISPSLFRGAKFVPPMRVNFRSITGTNRANIGQPFIRIVAPRRIIGNIGPRF